VEDSEGFLKHDTTPTCYHWYRGKRASQGLGSGFAFYRDEFRKFYAPEPREVQIQLQMAHARDISGVSSVSTIGRRPCLTWGAATAVLLAGGLTEVVGYEWDSAAVLQKKVAKVVGSHREST